MTADMITLQNADDLNVIRGPEFKKIKFHPVSYDKIKKNWLQSADFGLSSKENTSNDMDKLAMLGAVLHTFVKNIRTEEEHGRAIKLRATMFNGVCNNANQFYAKENKPVQENVMDSGENVSNIVDSVEEQQEAVASEITPSVQETVAALDLQEIKGAVEQAFANVDDSSKQDEVSQVKASKEDNMSMRTLDEKTTTTKIVKNSKGKAKVQKFSNDEKYHLNPDASKSLSPIVSSMNDDIFGKKELGTAMERVVPIVAADRMVPEEEKKDNKLFHFSENDNVVAIKEADSKDEDTTSKKIADLGRLYDEFHQETDVTPISKASETKNGVEEISELDKVKAAREKLLEVLRLKEEQDRKTKEAKDAAEAAEAERLAIVQKALESAENERKALEESLNASKEQERQNKEKAARENRVIEELSAMFQGTPVNFVIPTKNTAARGGK